MDQALKSLESKPGVEAVEECDNLVYVFGDFRHYSHPYLRPLRRLGMDLPLLKKLSKKAERSLEAYHLIAYFVAQEVKGECRVSHLNEIWEVAEMFKITPQYFDECVKNGFELSLDEEVKMSTIHSDKIKKIKTRAQALNFPSLQIAEWIENPSSVSTVNDYQADFNFLPAAVAV